jgi:hypothetical protein
MNGGAWQGGRGNSPWDEKSLRRLAMMLADGFTRKACGERFGVGMKAIRSGIALIAASKASKAGDAA